MAVVSANQGTLENGERVNMVKCLAVARCSRKLSTLLTWEIREPGHRELDRMLEPVVRGNSASERVLVHC